MQHWNRMPDALKEQVFSRLEELAAVANLSMDDRIAYDRALDRYRVSRIVEEDTLKAGWEKGKKEGLKEGLEKGIQKGMKEGMQKGMKRGLEKGMKEGIEKGIEKGIKEGIEKGLEKGRAEEKSNIARNMKELGMPTEQITMVTGMSKEEIELL